MLFDRKYAKCYRKVLILLFTLMVLITSGCNKDVIKHNYTFKGENEFWDVVYTVDATEIFTKKNGTLEYDSNSDNLFTATYKKELSNLSSVKNLKISFESHVGGGSISEEYTDDPPTNKTYSMMSGNEGGALENKDEVIKVTINIDGNIQTMDLKNLN